MYALVEIKGKQYKIEKGSLLKVDHIAKDAGETVEFDKVLMFSDKEGVRVGTPYLKGVTVKATVGESTKGAKVKVVKFKRRKGYHRTQGHRQKYTMLKVDEL